MRSAPRRISLGLNVGIGHPDVGHYKKLEHQTLRRAKPRHLLIFRHHNETFRSRTYFRLLQNLTRKVIVVEYSMDAKSIEAGLLHNTCHFPRALDPQFLTALVWRG